MEHQHVGTLQVIVHNAVLMEVGQTRSNLWGREGQEAGGGERETKGRGGGVEEKEELEREGGGM